VRRETCIFAREDASLVGDKLLEQVDVLEIEDIDGEIDLRFGRGVRISP